jgi:penicillin-insensitive murein endopeptidase
VHLDESPWLRVTPCYANEDVRWGIQELVSLVDHGARAVHHLFPDSVLSVGHLSRRGGGDLDRHASHESGRDADVGFYVTNQQGKPIYAEHFVKFLGDGTAPSWPGARFDDARNWAFISAIVSDPRAKVSHVFVAAPLRARLLDYAQRMGAPYATRVRASEVMAQPRGSLPHDDHFHVRISCPAFMSGCVEQPTRNLARAKAPAGRARGPAASQGISHAPAQPAAPPAAARPSVTPHAPKPVPEESVLGAGAARGGVVPVAPELDPPVVLEAPIDDVDGVIE